MNRFPINSLIVAGFALSAIGTVAAAELTSAQVWSRLEAAGYTNIQNIHREGDHFGVKATKDGKPVSLDVDAQTGAITPEKGGKDDKQHK